MNIKPISNQQNFEGKVILNGKISRPHRPLIDRNRAMIDAQIKDMPFDILVKESKSKKHITLSTNVEGADTFVVNRRKPNLQETAGLAIADGRNKSVVYKKMVKANEIINYTKMQMLYIFDGKFKEAHEMHKEMAKIAVEDFDTYKKATNFKITNLPPEAGKPLLINSLKYKVYYAFSEKTPDEKQLEKMNKEYMKKMKANKEKPKPQIIKFTDPYYWV